MRVASSERSPLRASKEQFSGQSAVVTYLTGKGDSHEIHHNRTGNCIHIHGSKHVGGRTRRNAHRKFRQSAIQLSCRFGSYCEPTKECYGEYVRPDRT
jgi:hypothetical protein